MFFMYKYAKSYSKQAWIENLVITFATLKLAQL